MPSYHADTVRHPSVRRSGAVGDGLPSSLTLRPYGMVRHLQPGPGAMTPSTRFHSTHLEAGTKLLNICAREGVGKLACATEVVAGMRFINRVEYDAAQCAMLDCVTLRCPRYATSECAHVALYVAYSAQCGAA